ncbi:MAG: DNA helicase RecQ [Syntrophobacteraceae bacterium]
MIQQAKQILKSVFGYDHFISLQRDIIENVLLGNDTLAVMPTGGGKSLCYQIPALVLDGLTIVVSPLISLMKDQVEQLAQVDVPCVLLNSSLPPPAYRWNVERIRSGEARLLYIAPETLLKPNILALLDSVSVPLFAIDEAHCISEWGPDFRPEYRQLALVRERLAHAVCIALTATATPRVRRDIADCLGFGDSNHFIASFNRENLLIRVVPKEDPLKQTTGFLGRFQNESGIIYCLTRKQVDALCAVLESKGFSVCPYHAGLDETTRNRHQERFVRDEVRIIVATIAFGMGINKSNIRFVLHYDLPRNIESYYQEIGRAGRDGMRAECLLLFSAGDVYKIKHFIDGKEGLEKRAASLQINAMVQFAESDVCRRIPLLGYFGEKFSLDRCGMCDNCLHSDRETVDLTIAAQKFLSCVKRTGERFGAVYLIDVLRGSKASRILQNGHERLSTHGIGLEYSKSQWQQISRRLLHKGFMTQDMEIGGLSLTDKAWDILKGRETFFGSLYAPREAEKPLKEAPEKGDLDFDRQLFEILRQKRRELASEAGVPPYVIFSDRTLAEMAAFFPQSAESMLDISGVGAARLERHGTLFISLISQYCEAQGTEEKPRTRPVPRKREKSRSVKQALIGEAFNAGQSVEELSIRFDIKRQRVLWYLWGYFQEGNPLRAEGLRPLITISLQHFQKVLTAFEELGDQYLRPVFESLQGTVSYDDLRLINLYRLAGQRPFVPCGNGELKPRPAKIVCLANSRKYSGRCIAGKELLPDGIGNWIRPVSGIGTGELSPSEITLKEGRAPELLDILVLHLGEECPHFYQTENRVAADTHWSREGAIPKYRLPELCDGVEKLWINGHHSQSGMNDRVPMEIANEKITSSLLFIRASDFCVIVGEDIRGLRRILAEFRYNGVQYRLPVTDPIAEASYMSKDPGRYCEETAEVFLTVSISEPYGGFCYKLVAAIILAEAGNTEPEEFF